MHFTCRSFIGHPSDASWSQFWEMEPDDPVLVSRRGHLFGLINLVAADTSAGTRGRQLIDQINEFYYSSVNDSIISQLTNTLTHFSGTSDSGSDHLSLILAVVSGDHLHLAIFNSGQCILKRGNLISSLFIGQSGSVVTISGQNLDADLLLLCTDTFYHDFSWENIKSSLSVQSLDNIEENFLSRLYSLEHQSQLAGALVEIHQDPSDDSQPPDHPESVEEPPPSPTKKSLFSFFPRRHPSYIAHLDSPSVTRRKKINFLLALIILVALFASIFLGYRRNLSRTQENQYQTLKLQLEAKISNAQMVKGLSLNDALIQSKDAESLLQKMFPFKTKHADEITKFQDTINNLLSQTGSADSFTPELFFDTSLISNGLPYAELTLSGNSLYLLDAVNGHIDKLDIVHKSHQNIATTPDIKNSQFIAENNGILYLLKGSQVFSIQGNSLNLKINLPDQIKDFTAGELHFWNGSLYVLSVGSTTPSIWKYAPNVTGFTTGENWLKPKQPLPLNPSSFAINGSVWVISKSGMIASYSLGVKKDFKPTGLVNLTDVSNLVTSPDSNLLAFTDQSSQVYAYNKSGQSLGQYNFGNRKIQSLAYDQTSNTIFVLCTDKKIYKISL